MCGRTLSSAALEEDKRHMRQRKDHDGYSLVTWFDPSLFATDVGIAIFLALLVIAGVFIVIYVVAFVFTNLLSFGEVHRSRKYYKKVEAFNLDEREGSRLGRKLNQTNIYFSLVLLVFAIEEGARFILHTGPATFEIWVFRIICFALFAIIMAKFLVRLHRWLSFKSSITFQKTCNQIKEYEREPDKWFHAK